MKMTFDLPPDVARQLKLRAVHEGRKLKDVAAEALRAGLVAGASEPHRLQPPTIVKDPRTGLPVIQCPRTPTPEEELTPERLADILIEQEAEWARGSR